MNRAKLLLDSWIDMCVAGLDNWAAGLSESTKVLREREYYRGYADAIQDGSHLRPEEANHA